LFCWFFSYLGEGAGDIRGGGAKFTTHHSKEGRFMKKKSQSEIERSIVSHLKREMDKPRLTESVWNGFRAQPEPNAEKHAFRSART
jgi:hypothetical protein